MRIGVISDTHGLLRLEAVEALRGVEHILHAGDVGDAAILDELRQLAPVTAIRGNVDRRGACAKLPEIELVELGGCSIYMLHDLQALDLDPVAAGIHVVISGHSHKPLIEWRKRMLYFNPGSAGPHRFSLPVSIGFLDISGEVVEPKLVTIV
ncbi:metallophosphoesterase family protein [Alloacidobacterium dinghuense]|uniref:Phosphoesterase n=1 Tax=Alloacidobacterium dinghuense TaxID=2763107 RepID=A0A7G8BMJ8_9BACT|nr:metallophosphoesterase family protein [Alloacidobacterium dinghuense]QNI33768.1 metallophosphoesterase family protein [Alloacidobacterium dinghuense]